MQRSRDGQEKKLLEEAPEPKWWSSERAMGIWLKGLMPLQGSAPLPLATTQRPARRSNSRTAHRASYNNAVRPPGVNAWHLLKIAAWLAWDAVQQINDGVGEEPLLKDISVPHEPLPKKRQPRRVHSRDAEEIKLPPRKRQLYTDQYIDDEKGEAEQCSNSHISSPSKNE
jgi:hypothetical protein